MNKINIIGIGNLLMGDDGFGVEVANYLENNYIIPEEIQIIDGGTGGIMLGGYITSCEHLIIIDSIILEGEKSGTIYVFDYEGFKAKKISSHFSPHQIGIMEAIDLAGITDTIPKTITFFCVVPQKTEFEIGLTPEIQPKVKEIGEKIIKIISDAHNIKIENKNA